MTTDSGSDGPGPGYGTRKMLEVVAKELARPQHPGSVYLAFPMGVCEAFLKEHGVPIPETRKCDPADPRWSGQ